MSDTSRQQALVQLVAGGLRERQYITEGLRRMWRSPAGRWSSVTLLGFVLVAILAPVIAPYDPIAQDPTLLMSPPSVEHLLGTDQIGRDVLSRMIYGTQLSLLVGFFSVGLAVAIGVPLGLIAGWVGGKVDEVIMRVMDAKVAFPSLMLALAIVAVLGPGIQNVMIAIGITSIPIFARLVRAQVLSCRETDYITAARALGAHPTRILVRHVLPNVVAPIIVQGSLAVGYAVLAEAGLSFLGVGVKPPTPTWGIIMQQGFPFFRVYPWLSLIPGVAIFFLVLAVNAFGDVLRDILDPRLRGR